MATVTTLEEAGLLFRKIEAKMKVLEDELEVQQAPLKRAMEQLQVFMLQQMNTQGIKSVDIKEVGRIAITPKRTYGCGDWPLFGDYVSERKLTDLYQKRIHEGNMDEYIKSLPEGELPPGIKVTTVNLIKITKPKGSA